MNNSIFLFDLICLRTPERRDVLFDKSKKYEKYYHCIFATGGGGGFCAFSKNEIKRNTTKTFVSSLIYFNLRIDEFLSCFGV